MEHWNNVELADLSKKSYTLNHEFDLAKKTSAKNENDSVDGNSSNPNAQDGETVEIADNANESEVLQPGSDIKPKVDIEDVEALVRRLYGITTTEIKELISYDDRNYLINEDRNIKNPLIVSHCPHGYVLKILNALDSKKPDFVEAQNELLMYLSKYEINSPKPIANVNGKYFSVEHINGADYVVRLLNFIPGKMFHEVEKTNHLLYQSGEYLAKIDKALKGFNHDIYDTHKTVWMLQSVPQLRDFIYVLQDEQRKAMLEKIIINFETHVLSKLDKMSKQIIHGDYNEQNIVVEHENEEQVDYSVKGIIDFGDTNKSPVIFEIGIAMAYIMLQAKSLESGGIFLAGYTAINPISALEKDFLKHCVAARLAQSLIMGAYTHSLNPSNEYVLVTQEQGWKIVEELWREQFTNIDELWQTAADKYLSQSDK